MRHVLLVAIAACAKTPDASPPPRPVEAQVGEADTAPDGSLAWKTVDGPDALAAFVKQATAAHLKPYVYLHASWCGPCHAIEDTHAADPKMAAAFKGTAIALIDVDATDPKKLGERGLRADVIPAFYKLDPAGKPTGDKIDGGAWGDNIPENMAPPLAAFFART